jgi:hypothetical protein
MDQNSILKIVRRLTTINMYGEQRYLCKAWHLSQMKHNYPMQKKILTL